MDNVIARLASSQGINSTEPNKLLAKEIIAANDEAAVKVLAEHLSDKNKRIQSDCIKTLYEVGEQSPELIAPYAPIFIKLLDDKNNRMVWGGMTALSACAHLCAPALYQVITRIVDIADKGTVITRDHAVKILAALSAHNQYAPDTIPLLLEQVIAAPINQLPSYAETALSVIDVPHKQQLLNIINTRLPDVDSDAKIKRLEKVIKKLKK